SLPPRQTWVMYLWPYIEQDNLAAPVNFTTQDFYTPPCTVYNTLNGLTGQAVPLYSCPTDQGYGADLDNTSQTYCRRRGTDVVNWAISNGDPLMPVTTAGTSVNEFNAPRSRHTGGVNVLFCDGGVHFITNGIPLSTWQALGTMSAGDLPGTYE